MPDIEHKPRNGYLEAALMFGGFFVALALLFGLVFLLGWLVGEWATFAILFGSMGLGIFLYYGAAFEALNREEERQKRS